MCFHLLGNKTFRPTLRASYIHTEISNISTGLLHPHRNSGLLPESLTHTQKFGISPRVSYTHTEIRDNSLDLLHPHINLGSLPGSLTLAHKFGIAPWVFYTHINLGSLPESLTPTQKFGISPRVSYIHTEIRDISPGLLYPHRTFRILSRVSFTLTPGFSPEGINGPVFALPRTL